MTRPVRILWQRLDIPGAEWCQVSQEADGGRLTGVALVALDRRPHRLEYELELDDTGRTRHVVVRADGPDWPESVELSTDGSGSWRRGNDSLIEAPDCVDVDLGFSPITNSLPIWRLGLAVGESREIAVAWIQFPGLKVVEGRQTYERLAPLAYRYRSAGFEAVIRVAPDGLVEEYGSYWRAIARS